MRCWDRWRLRGWRQCWRLVPEVLELQRDAEILLLQGRDHRLQVVPLLARDPELIALGLGRDALAAQALAELVDRPGASIVDPDVEGGRLADRTLGRFFELAVGHRLERHLTPHA